MRIGELAQEAGVSVRSLRYYEEQGLLSPTRSPGGQREYATDDVGRVLFYQDLFAAGLSSRRIADLMPCIETGTTTREQRTMLEGELTQISARIDALEAARGRLENLIDAARARPATPAA